MNEIEAQIHAIESSNQKASLNNFEKTDSHELYFQIINIDLVQRQLFETFSWIQTVFINALRDNSLKRVELLLLCIALPRFF